MPERMAAIILCSLALAACAGAQPEAKPRAVAAATGVKLTRVGSFNEPLFVTAPPADRHRLFVVEKGGAIRVLRDGKKLSRPFLSLAGRVSGSSEQGLLSMAFAPDYADSGRFYVDYTDLQGNSNIVEYHRSATDPDVADASSARRVLFQSQPEENHNGGSLVFGPDGLLYIGFGDGGGADDMHGPTGNGQRLSTLLGKILRIDPRGAGGRAYSIPASNPFVHRAGVRHEIYAYGLRNPWRFSFDRRTGDMTIGDVGQGAQEEVDFARRGTGRGANYGWRVFEGTGRHADGSAPHARRPVLTYPHTQNRCSITGGYVVRDRALGGLYGRYVYGDYCNGVLYSSRLRAGGASSPRRLGLTVPDLSSFGEDARGHVYVLSLDGPVYRLDPR